MDAVIFFTGGGAPPGRVLTLMHAGAVVADRGQATLLTLMPALMLKGPPGSPACLRALMSVRQAISAVIAAHGRLDQAVAVGVAALNERQACEAGMPFHRRAFGLPAA